MEGHSGLHLPKIDSLAELQTWYQEKGALGIAPDDLWIFETANEYGIAPQKLRDANEFLPPDQIRFVVERGFDLDEVVEWDWRDLQWMMMTEAAQILAREQLRERKDGRNVSTPKHNRRRPRSV